MQRWEITPYEGTEPDIFVSYAHKDTALVFRSRRSRTGGETASGMMTVSHRETTQKINKLKKLEHLTFNNCAFEEGALGTLDLSGNPLTVGLFRSDAAAACQS